MRRHRREMTPLTQINLTSLLDVAFVLLIAFMIVAPALKYGLHLDLPTITQGAPQLSQDQPTLYTILVPRPQNGAQEYFLNDTPCQLKDIEDRLSMQNKQGTKVAVEIQADKEVPYETFIQVAASVRRAGVEALGLPVEPGNVKAPSPAASTPAPPAGAR